MRIFRTLAGPIETFSIHFDRLNLIEAKKLSFSKEICAEKIWVSNLEERLDRELIRQHRVILPPSISQKLNKKYFIPDAFDPETLTVFEYNENKSHGNPNLYPSNLIHPKARVSYGYLFHQTELKRKIYNLLGYPVYSRWENNPY